MGSNLKQNICKAVVIVFFISFICYIIQKYKTYQQKTIKYVNKARENFQDTTTTTTTTPSGKVYDIPIRIPLYTLSLTETQGLTVLTKKGTTTRNTNALFKNIIESFKDVPTTTTQSLITRAQMSADMSVNYIRSADKIASAVASSDVDTAASVDTILNDLLIPSSSPESVTYPNDFDCVTTHILLPDKSYVPIKIIPFCKLNNDNNLVFMFLLDRLSDEQYNTYVIKNTDLGKVYYKNLPLLSSDGEKVYSYEINQDGNELLSFDTVQNFTLPFLTDITLEVKHNLDKKISVLKDYKRIELNQKGESTSYLPFTINNFKGTDASYIYNLDTLEVSLFGFNNSGDITSNYQSNIDYFEIMKYANVVHKINGTKITITLDNNKWINIKNDDIILRFIMYSPDNTSFNEQTENDKIDETVPEIHTNNSTDTTYELNKENYKIHFYVPDSEKSSVGIENIYIIAALYKNDTTSTPSSSKLIYFERVYSFKLADITQSTDTTQTNSADVAAKYTIQIPDKPLTPDYHISHTFGFINPIETLPGGFKDIFDNENDIYAKKLNESFKQTKLNDYFTDLLNYSFSKVLKRDNLIENEKKYKKTSELVGKCNRGDFLTEFRKIKPLKTKKVEHFANDWNPPIKTTLYTNGLVNKDIFMKSQEKDKIKTHSFNSELGDYMYPYDTTNMNTVRVTQKSNDRDKALKLFNRSGTPSNEITVNIRDLILPQNYDNPPEGSFIESHYIIDKYKLNSTTINITGFSQNKQTTLCSNNLLFKALTNQQPSQNGVYNRLINPCTNYYTTPGTKPDIRIPDGFNVNIDNTSEEKTHPKEGGWWECNLGVILAVFAAILTVVTLGATGNLVWAALAVASAVIVTVGLIVAAVIGIIEASSELLHGDDNTSETEKQALERMLRERGEETKKYIETMSNKINFLYKNLELQQNNNITPEDLLNLRQFYFQKAEDTGISTPENHSLEKAGQDYANRGDDDRCNPRTDLRSSRTLKSNSNNTEYDIKPKSYYTKIDQYIGLRLSSPNIEFMKKFNYLYDDNVTKNENCYYDLEDGGISINDFGGLNYHEIYANYISDKSGPARLPGIINLKGTDTNLETITWTNHIGAHQQFVPEKEALYKDLENQSFSFKFKTSSLDMIHKQLLQIGVTQLLLADNLTSTTDISADDIDKIYNLDKYITYTTDTFKNIPPTSSSSPTSTSSTLTPPPPTPAATAPFINTSSQPNQSTRFPVKETFYMSEQPIYNNLIYKPQHMYDTSQNRNHFQDSGDTGCGDRLCILDANNKFAVDIVNKVAEQGTHLSFKEDYYYVTIKVTYIGKTFKTKGNFFYMTCELFEYPKQIYYEKDKIKNPYDPITDSYFFNRDNSITISNSRIGMGAFDFETYKDYLRNGDTFDFKIRIDKNIKEAQRFNMDTHDCKVGGDYEFNENCRINLNDMYYAVIYFKNYDEIISDGTFGIVQSFSYKAYPEGIPNHQNEHVFLNTESIKEKLAVSYSGNKRYIALQFVNGITFKLDNSFKSLRAKQEVSILTPNYGIAGNQEQGDEDQFYCPDGGTLKSFKTYHDKNSIVGVEGICNDGSYTGCAGTCEDTLNPDVIPINNKKIIFGHRAFNKNGISYSDVHHTNEDSSVIGSPYSNKNSDDIAMSNYIHEISEYGGTNKMAGTERELYYINNRELLTCQDNDDQKIIGFQGNVVSKGDDTDSNTRISALGFMCDKIPIGIDIPTTTKPLISNVVLPGYNTYHMRDQNNNYIGVNKTDGHYSLLIIKQKPQYNDHRFKFIIRYKSSSNNIYHIISAKFLVENGTNVILTTSQLDGSSSIDIFKQNSFGIDASNEYSINSLFDENDRNDPQNYKTYHLNSTFQLDLDDSYCAIIGGQLQCNQMRKNLNHRFTLEKTTEVPQPIATKQPAPIYNPIPPIYNHQDSQFPNTGIVESDGGYSSVGNRIDNAQKSYYGP